MNAEKADNITGDSKYAVAQQLVGEPVTKAQQLRDKLCLAAKMSKTRWSAR